MKRFGFIAGLFTGVLIGLIIGWLMLDNSGPENALAEVSADGISVVKENERLKNEEVGDSPGKIPQQQTPTSNEALIEVDSLVNDTLIIDTLIASIDTIPIDTVFLAALDDTISRADEEIIIRKDELVSSMKVELLSWQAPSENTSAVDSLASEVADVQLKPEGTMIIVEFWRSPINYRGYKMGNNKILLFGLGADDGAQVIQYDNLIFLKHLGSYYQVDNTFAFKPYATVTDTELLVILNDER